MSDLPEPYIDPEVSPYPYAPPFIAGIQGFYFGPKESGHGGFLPYEEYAARYRAKTEATGEDWGGNLMSALMNDLDEHFDHSRWEDASMSYAPYCWCGNDDCRYCGDEVAPFFHWKPTDLRLRWYKHAARGLRGNRAWTASEVAVMRAALLDAP
jgi:hypothetical protein